MRIIIPSPHTETYKDVVEIWHIQVLKNDPAFTGKAPC